MTQRFDIFFSGKILDQQDPVQVRANVGRLFQADEDQLTHLFSGSAVRIKAAVDQETAINIRTRFLEAGALVEIRPAGQEPPMESTDDRQEADEPFSLLPPNTGDLLDCATEVEAAPLPDISGISLSPAGADLDETPPPPPAHIDTGDLSLNPPNTGSLEDCQKQVPAQPLPDISGMTLEQREKEGD